MKRLSAILLTLVLTLSLLVSCSQVEGTTGTNGTAAIVDPGDPSEPHTTKQEYNFEGTWKATLTLDELTYGILLDSDLLNDDETGEEGTEISGSTSTAKPDISSYVYNAEKYIYGGNVNVNLSFLDEYYEFQLPPYERSLTFTLTFTGDKYSISVDRAECEKLATSFANAIIQNIKIVATNDGKDYAAVLKSYGYESEAALRESYKNALAGSLSQTNKSWSFDGTTLSLEDEGDFTFSSGGSSSFSLTNSNITFTYEKA